MTDADRIAEPRGSSACDSVRREQASRSPAGGSTLERRRKNASPEFQLSLAVADFLRLVVSPHVPWTHIGHGEVRDKRTAAKLKAMGLKPGWADYVFILPGGRAAFIELKAPGSYQTPDQRAFEASVAGAGAMYLVCRSVPEVDGALRAWGLQLRGHAA